MRLRKLIKTNARRALCSNWTRAAAISLVALVLSLMFLILEGIVQSAIGIELFSDPFQTPDFFLDDIPNASAAAVLTVSAAALLYVVIMAPFELGVVRWFYRLGDARVEEASAVFEFFGSARAFIKPSLLRFSVLGRCACWLAVFTAAPTALLVFAGLSADRSLTDLQGFLSSAMGACGVALLTLSVLLWAVWCMRYYLADIALAEDIRRSVGEAVRRSVHTMRGHRLELALFEVSMLGWRLLDVLVLPRLYTLPYRQTARGLYARYLFEMAKRARAQVI